jgi:hypothetical protein
MPLNGSDRVFTPYTAEKVDPLVDQAITHLERQIEQLRSLKGAAPEIATVIGRCQSALKNDPGSALNFDPARDDGSGAMVMRFDGSGPVLEAPALVAGLDDVTVMG